jgi:hypothetical protein
MIATRDVMKINENVNYPELSTCFCGQEAPLKKQDIKTKYNGKYILVRNVPVYLCSSDHVNIARLTRISIKRKLKLAYEEGLEEIDF